MIEPKFKPESWVIFKTSEHSQAFGKIKGGVNNENKWVYIISNSYTSKSSSYFINEDDIIEVINI